MQKPLTLQPGDSVEIIAPASRCSDQELTDLKELLNSWQLNCIVDNDIFGNDLLCANTDEIRLKLLKNALLRPETKAVICARGGYGSLRLIPGLSQIASPLVAKLFIGMSDLTALNLYLQQQWQWPIIHGALAPSKFSEESITAVKSILFGDSSNQQLCGLPLNTHAEKQQTIETTVTGGNLCLVQTSIGTLWQVNAKHKIMFLEDVGERGYKIDRMLEQLRQTSILNDAAAIILGDFIGGNEPDGSSLVQQVLQRFAQSCEIPVVKVEGVGHGHTNFPVLMGTMTKLHLGSKISLVFDEN